MEEKRKNKRLDLDVNVQLERLDEEGVTTLKFVHVDVTDISKVTSTNIPKIETKSFLSDFDAIMLENVIEKLLSKRNGLNEIVMTLNLTK